MAADLAELASYIWPDAGQNRRATGTVGVDPFSSLRQGLVYSNRLGADDLDIVGGRVSTRTAISVAPLEKGATASIFTSGNSSQIALPTSDMVSGYPLTVSCWADLTDAGGGEVIFSLNGTSYNAIFGLVTGWLAVNPASAPGFESATNTYSGLHHVVVVFRSGSWSLYVDGVLDTSQLGGRTQWGTPAAGNHSIGSRLGGASLRYNNGPISDLNVWSRELSAQEARLLYQNAGQPYSAPTIGSAMVFTGSGPTYPRIGTFDAQLRAEAWFDRTAVVEGWFTDELIPAGSTSGVQSLAAAANSTDTATAALAKSASLAAAAASVDAATAAIALTVPLAASATASDAATADLSAVSGVSLAAAAAAQDTASADLAKAVSLAGAAVATDAATADLLKGVALAAAALSVDSASAGMALSVPLAATAAAVATATGQMALTVTFSASAVSQALATAALSLAKPLAADATGQGTATADLSVAAGGSVTLAANAASVASAGATLSLAVNLSAAALGVATASAELGGSVLIAAAAIANAQASAAMAVGKPLATSAQSSSTASATLWLQVPLTAAALSAAAAGAGLALAVNLSAAASSSASGAGALVANVHLAAAGVSVDTATASLQISAAIDPALNRTLVARQSRRRWRYLAAARPFITRQTWRTFIFEVTS